MPSRDNPINSLNDVFGSEDCACIMPVAYFCESLRCGALDEFSIQGDRRERVPALCLG